VVRDSPVCPSDAVVTAMSHTRKKVLQGFVVFSVILLLLWLAAFLYGSFYYSYMPKAAFSTPVHYYYRTDCESPSSFLCSYPVANISLMRNKKHVLTFGQAYQISLQLELPESPTNQELGMFMVKTTCFSRDGGQIASSARSSMLRYRSDLLRTMGTLLFLPAFLSGAIEQKQMLEVELFSDFTDDPYAPSVTAVIEILSNKVQIYSSQLYVHAHFTGIRYLLFYFPVSSALVGVSSNFIFLSVLFILSYMRLLLRVEWKPDIPHRQHLRHDEAVQATERKEDAEPTTKCARDEVRAKWRARRKEKLGGSCEADTDRDREKGRWSGKRRVEETGGERELDHKGRDGGTSSDWKHWRNRNSSFESERKEEGGEERKRSISVAEDEDSGETLEEKNEEAEELRGASTTHQWSSPHPILSKLLHSSSSTSSCSSINLSSAESDEVFSEGEDAGKKRKAFRKVRMPETTEIGWMGFKTIFSVRAFAIPV
uniref:Seipin n=1 Tax=Seriola dumerili TaxID=41447 RepID=A0A3B4V0Y0_SERDU